MGPLFVKREYCNARFRSAGCDRSLDDSLDYFSGHTIFFIKRLSIKRSLTRTRLRRSSRHGSKYTKRPASEFRLSAKVNRLCITAEPCYVRIYTTLCCADVVSSTQ